MQFGGGYPPPQYSSGYAYPQPPFAYPPSPSRREGNEKCYYDQATGAYIYPPSEPSYNYNEGNYARQNYYQPPPGVPIDYSSQRERGCRESECGGGEMSRKNEEAPGCFARCCLG